MSKMKSEIKKCSAFNSCFDKTQLKNLIGWFLEQYGEKITIDFLETLKEVGFHQATLAGVSLGIDDLQIPTQKSKLLSQALVKIQELNSEFNKAKMAIGDVELQKQQIISHIEGLKIQFSAHEKELIEKYGADAVINIQTGEVTQKEE